MPASIPAYVNPALLIWARQDAGLAVEQVAKKVHVKPERIEAWERGDLHPSVTQLKTLGRVYHRPIAVFYLSAPPSTFRPMHDYRRLGGMEAGAESPELRYQVRRAQERRALAIDIAQLLGEVAPSLGFKVRVGDDAEAAGEAVRRFLELSVSQQRAWPGEREAFNGWRAAIERQGVMVFQIVDVPVAEARGFSIGDQPFPVIAVNRKDSLHGRIFSLIHEFIHLAAQRGGLCDLRETGARGSGDERVEVFCNAVAAATLLPSSALLAHDVVRAAGSHSREWSDIEFEAISREFRVSREAALRRLLTLGLTSQTYYERMRRRYLQAPPPREKAKGPIPRHIDVLSAGGRLYAGIVLRGYYEERITSSDVADALNLKLKHLVRLEHALGATAMAV